MLDYDQRLVPRALASSGPYGLEGNDITLAALSSVPPALDAAYDRDIIAVSDTDPLPRVFVWRDLRYVDDTRH